MTSLRKTGSIAGVSILAALIIIAFLIFSADAYRERVIASNPAKLEIDGGALLEPELLSRAAVLYDVRTGELLYEKNGDLSIPPASMTKLMTLHLAYREIERGELSRDTEIVVEAPADFRNQAAGSSLMFIEEGQRLTVFELMRGVAVPSGNDAAVALARTISGTVEAFVEKMNAEAARMELEGVQFVDPAGIEPENRVTARSFGRFCRTYIREHPYALEELHSLQEFTYPKMRNLTRGSSVYGSITQENYNLLVGRHPWIDGLKTGYIEESGYNIAVTAQKEGRRVVAVIMGGPGESTREGNLSRLIDGTNLISYGLYAFCELEPKIEEEMSTAVHGGDGDSVRLQVPQIEPLLLPAREAGAVRLELRLREPLWAPLEKGAEVGSLHLIGSEGEHARYPITAGASVSRGGFLRRVRDYIDVELIPKL